METRELRKNRDILMITGMGVLAFGLWNMIKVIMFFTLERKMISEMLISSIGSVEGSTDEEIKIIYRIAYVIFLMVILLVIAIDILIRLYIARCAVAEARGHKKGNMYLVFAGIMIVLSLLSMLYAFKGITPDPDKIIDTVSTFVVEITSFVTLTEMFAAVHRIR